MRQQWQSDALHGHPQMVSDEQANRLLAGEDREAERQFYRDDEEAAAMSRALRDVDQRTAELVAAMHDAGAPPALLLLADLFGLNEFEQSIPDRRVLDSGLQWLADERIFLAPQQGRNGGVGVDNTAIDVNHNHAVGQMFHNCPSGNGWDIQEVEKMAF